jgi:hypothetical protein
VDEDVPDGPPPLPRHLEVEDTPAERRSGTLAASVAAGVVVAALVLSAGGAAAWRLGTRAADGLASAVWGSAIVDTVVIDADELRSRTDASCERLVGARGPEPEEERTHLDDAEAAELTADDLYELRPPHSGRHLGRFLPLPTEAFDRPIDERALVHNLEHGAVAVLYDPSALADADVEALEAWVRERNVAGFAADAERTGAAIAAAPVEPGSITSGAAVALRAWGVATDCDAFDRVIADGFVASHFGTRGVAPEGSLAPYPSGALELIRPDV